MTGKARVTVLYEDQWGETGKWFAPHEFVLGLVADRLGKSIPELRENVKPWPCNGNANVFKKLRTADRIGGWVLALLDDDCIRSQGEVKLSATAGETEVVDRVLSITGTSGFRGVVLLVKNMESVIQAARACELNVSPVTIDRALRKKPNDRDIVLNAAVWGSTPQVRNCIVEQVPGLADLRDRIVCALN